MNLIHGDDFHDDEDDEDRDEDDGDDDVPDSAVMTGVSVLVLHPVVDKAFSCFELWVQTNT